MLLKLAFLVAMVVVLLSVPTKQATASCTYTGGANGNCMVQGCYDQVYCQAIECLLPGSYTGSFAKSAAFASKFGR